jgi:hypothetical protein
MADNQDTLGNNQRLQDGHFLRSKNGLFHALMQDDGNFVVYRGDLCLTKAEDYEKTALWSAFPIGHAPGVGTGYFLYMQADGNLCIYRTTPSVVVYSNPDTFKNRATDGRVLVLKDDGQLFISGIWGSNGTDSYGEVELEKLEYITKDAKITSLGPPKLSVGAVVTNDLAKDQLLELTASYAKTTTTSWKVSTTLKIAAKTSFKCGVPSVAEGSVEVSTEFTQGFEWNKSTTDMQRIDIKQSVLVEPKKPVVLKVTWRESGITLPYRAIGKIKFNGYPDMLPVHLEGVYSGTASHDLHISWKYCKPDSKDALKNLAPSAALDMLGDEGWTQIR